MMVFIKDYSLNNVSINPLLSLSQKKKTQNALSPKKIPDPKDIKVYIR